MPDPLIPTPYIALVGSAIGLSGTLAGLLVTWWKEANRDARRLRALDEATKEMTFWEIRLRIQAAAMSGEQLETAKIDTLAQIDIVNARLLLAKQLYQPPHAERAPPLRHHNLSFVRLLKGFLLLNRPKRKLVWVPRLFYWLGIAWFFFDMPYMTSVLPEALTTLDSASFFFLILFGPAALFYVISKLLDWPWRSSA